MSEPSTKRTGAQILVDQLLIHGIDHVFCVPGESYIAVLDALYDASASIRLISCRQEGGAANMAEAYGKLTGKPGICFVTRGPGASHASVGVHTASQDSTPMILFIGQVRRSRLEREAFQEIDFRQMFRSVAKWVAQIDDPRRIPELVGRAFQLAVSGRPGPVVLALPEDMLAESCVTPDASAFKRAQALPSVEQLTTLRSMLSNACRPLMIVGGSDWTASAAADILAFSETNQLPAIAAFRRQDIFDNHSVNYIGELGISLNPALAQRIKDADLLLLVGDRLSELTTSGYTLIDIPRPKQMFIHVYPDPDELGRLYQTDLAIVSGMPEFATAARGLQPVDGGAWSEWVQAAHRDYLAHLRVEPIARGVNLAEVVSYLRERLPHDAVITNGAGNYTAWCHRFYQFAQYHTQLAPVSGAMGYGVPAAVAAKAIHPDRIVVAFAGDGCFLMTGQELATAVQYGLNIVILVVNNSMYGTIRMHQERSFPGRVLGTELINPNFAAYAEAFGAYGEVVEQTKDFAAAFERALAAGRPALLELRTDPEVITPRTTLSAIRTAATTRGSH